MDNHKKNQESWERFLNPDELRPTLMLASIYISTFEILKDSIISRIKNFYWMGFDEKGEIIDPKYTAEVLSRNNSLLYASLAWLKESEAIDDVDIEKFNLIKKQRNDIAHQMFRMLANGLPVEFTERFNEMVALLKKIEKWWIAVEAETGLFNIDDHGKLVDVDLTEVDLNEAIPGPIVSLKMLIDIAIGPDEKSRDYFNEFIKMTRKDS
jgi:hypothetical protein